MPKTELLGAYAHRRNETMEFPDHLRRRGVDRYAGVLMEDELAGPSGISAHFWLYPEAPVSRLEAAVRDVEWKRDVVRWQWDEIPQVPLADVLHYHVREILLRGKKDSSYLYYFHPDDVQLLWEIVLAYKATWPEIAKKPHLADLMRYPRRYAREQRKHLDAAYEGHMVETIGKDSLGRMIYDESPYYVDIQVLELELMIKIGNQVVKATQETSIVLRQPRQGDPVL